MPLLMMIGAVVMTGGALFTIWSNRQLRAVPLADRPAHPAWSRYGLGLGVTGAGAALIAVSNLFDDAASTGIRALSVVSLAVLATLGALVVVRMRRHAH